MNQGPASVDSSRQQGRIFIVGRHDDAKFFEGMKVFRQRERYARTAAGIGGVGDSILLELRHVGDSGILDAPQFFGELLRFGQERGLVIDVPLIDAVYRARCAQVREAAAIFHAAEEKRGPIGQKCRARIENTIHGIGPVFCRQDRIRRVPGKQGVVLVHYLSQEQFDSECQAVLAEQARKKACQLVRACYRLYPLPPACAFPEVPSGRTASIPRPGSHWRGRDAGRRGTRRCWDRRGPPANRCPRETN